MCNLTISVSILLLAVILLAKTVESKPDGRIIGGDVARAGQFPYSAAIYITTSEGNYFCGGSVITKDWVLTAGQCVDGATLFTILLGSNSLSVNGEESVKVATDFYVLHPDYNPLTLENDVGLIKFRLSITYSDYIASVNYILDITITDGMVLTAIGWGQTSDEQAGLEDELHYATVAAISNDECKITYGSQITENMLCVEGNYNEGTCSGDIGGPLIYGNRGYAYQVGIASFISGNGCESTDPSGFTRIAPYRAWIRNITTLS